MSTKAPFADSRANNVGMDNHGPKAQVTKFVGSYHINSSADASFDRKYAHLFAG